LTLPWLPWLAGLDGAVVEAHCVGLANRLCDELELPQRDSAIVSVPVSVVADAADKLRAAGLRASVRAGAVRVGFHVYNTDEDLERLLDALG
jgi:selenocysteine lyase/cysteine desulfurase